MERMRLLDIGGGFEPGSFVETSEVIAEALGDYFPGYGQDGGVKVIAEPGRFFVSEAFSLACCVIARRGPAPALDPPAEEAVKEEVRDGEEKEGDQPKVMCKYLTKSAYMRVLTSFWWVQIILTTASTAPSTVSSSTTNTQHPPSSPSTPLSTSLPLPPPPPLPTRINNPTNLKPIKPLPSHTLPHLLHPTPLPLLLLLLRPRRIRLLHRRPLPRPLPPPNLPPPPPRRNPLLRRQMQPRSLCAEVARRNGEVRVRLC